MFQKTLGLFLNEIVASEILEFPINVDDEGALYAAAQSNMKNLSLPATVEIWTIISFINNRKMSLRKGKGVLADIAAAR